MGFSIYSSIILASDRIEGGAGDDIELDGGKGTDRVDGNDGEDNIFGGDDSDVSSSTAPGFGDCITAGGLNGGNDDYYIEGGMGIDTINRGYDNDECQGGPQNDTFTYCECGDEGPLSGPQSGGETEALAPCI